MLGAALWIACRTDELHWIESIFLFVSAGTITGAIGIVHAHELMHRQGRLPRFLGDWLMAMTFYSHFRSEHLHVHHIWVGTPRDAVTARYNENIYQFFLRVVPQAFISAWHAEAQRLARRGLPVWSFKNPFWHYAALQVAMLIFAYAIGGWMGVALMLV
ncbi:MAG: alkane 1-monooxygenase, partial [Alphaproteobacteria bacterium]|nr:alkane 1-monooxygenase [Alphaproteobacteria bacterium]